MSITWRVLNQQQQGSGCLIDHPEVGAGEEVPPPDSAQRPSSFSCLQGRGKLDLAPPGRSPNTESGIRGGSLVCKVGHDAWL